jgi:hypothetical protein
MKILFYYVNTYIHFAMLIYSYFCGSLPQRISRQATNFCSASRAKKALAIQRERPLGRAPLADKDADLQRLRRTSHSVGAGRS